MKKEIVDNCIECIKNKQWVEFEDGFPFYNPAIIALEDELYATLCMDANYIENYNNIKDLPINELSITQIYTYLSYIFKTEQFVIGHIDQYCQNGILEQLLERV